MVEPKAAGTAARAASAHTDCDFRAGLGAPCRLIKFRKRAARQSEAHNDDDDDHDHDDDDDDDYDDDCDDDDDDDDDDDQLCVLLGFRTTDDNCVDTAEADSERSQAWLLIFILSIFRLQGMVIGKKIKLRQ